MLLLPQIPDRWEPLGHVYAHHGLYLSDSLTLHNLFILDNDTREALEARGQFERVRLALYHEIMRHAQKLGGNCIASFSFTIQKIDSYYLLLQAQGICGILDAIQELPVWLSPAATGLVKPTPRMANTNKATADEKRCDDYFTQEPGTLINGKFPDIGLEHQLEWLDKLQLPSPPSPPTGMSDEELLSIQRVKRKK